MTAVPSNLPKLPDFKPAHPEFCFNLVKQTFNICALDDDARFTCLMNHLLNHDDLIYALVRAPPLVEKYAVAKQTILKRISKSRRENLRQLIYEECLGDRSVSQLWWCLHLLVNEQVMPDDTHTEIWTESYVVSSNGLAPPQDKIKPVLDMRRLQTYKELCRFIRTVSYYRKHWPDASAVQAPLPDALAGPHTSGTPPSPKDTGHGQGI